MAPFIPRKFILLILACIVLMILVGGILAEIVATSIYIYKSLSLPHIPNCEESCGQLKIPYPFGTRDGCFLNLAFFIACTNFSNSPIPYWKNFQVLSISANAGEMNVLTPVASDCYTSNGTKTNSSSLPMFIPWPGFSFSHSRNRFTAVGCDTYAMFEGPNLMTGCMSLCASNNSVTDGVCSGAGCCQTSIRKGLNGMKLTLGSYANHTAVWDFNPCSFSFLAANDFYDFSARDLRDYNLRGYNMVPTVLDWVVGNQTCQEARKDPARYACRDSRSFCDDMETGQGYRCHCPSGYQGNPYLLHGCLDVDECSDPKLNDCKEHCINTEGGYSCFESSDHLIATKISVGIGVGLLVMTTVISFLYLALKRRKLIELKAKFFEKNGGVLLQQLIAQREISPNLIKIFTAEELETATKEYDEGLIVGRGGYGTVYKGTLSNGSSVAIKKSKQQTDTITMDETQVKQFISEVVVLCQVNHRNIVRLLGCCLETPSPILVYEFIENGTLFEHLHRERGSLGHLSWETRLRIASKTAEVLSYLHSQAFTPIIHRDIKSTNILLDHNFDPKVSDFGASRLIPSDEMQVCTVVQGTLGYLDPEYLQTSQLTEKSDVYSFGVVLVELLTGEKAVRSNRPEEERSLAMYFLSALQENQFNRVIDGSIRDEGSLELFQHVADIARRCLSVKGEERPMMKQVAIELEGILSVQVDRHNNSSWIPMELNSEQEAFAR